MLTTLLIGALMFLFGALFGYYLRSEQGVSIADFRQKRRIALRRATRKYLG